MWQATNNTSDTTIHSYICTKTFPCLTQPFSKGVSTVLAFSTSLPSISKHAWINMELVKTRIIAKQTQSTSDRSPHPKHSATVSCVIFRIHQDSDSPDYCSLVGRLPAVFSDPTAFTDEKSNPVRDQPFPASIDSTSYRISPNASS